MKCLLGTDYHLAFVVSASVSFRHRWNGPRRQWHSSSPFTGSHARVTQRNPQM
jgi:hypothetical protein